MDWCFRLYGLAIASAACLGFTGLLVNRLARLAQSPHGNTLEIVTLTILLIFWVIISACIYPFVCVNLFPWSGLWCCLASLLHAIRSVARLLCLPCRRARARQPRLWSSGSDGGQGYGLMMNVLPREGPVDVGRARIVAGAVDIPADERRLNGHSTCPVCRCDVFAPLPGEAV